MRCQEKNGTGWIIQNSIPQVSITYVPIVGSYGSRTRYLDALCVILQTLKFSQLAMYHWLCWKLGRMKKEKSWIVKHDGSGLYWGYMEGK